IPSFVTDRDERIFADPDTFNAERSKRERYQHHAFGAGAHKCIGLHVAKMEVKVVVKVGIR
ncbi:MAG: cytochrome P450, partial [Pseudomonadota bacterium]|nr:cytochrome P450 [Pseudomonadota bacterium]